ncbi:MAG: TonB-dependent receptor [Hydrocarboniphaga sp.]|uniref:TonB-dependent receptor n=1 Tax=Hydrocarboniphaga sp. TaxID=2033016 RepID=UPI002605E76E|nr:TonB-dependent receptor [Hydrocarboniphaga sp.]MDB5971654.1 TonB-dependent receptor [Hydrocarboniphaga sp.]
MRKHELWSVSVAVLCTSMTSAPVLAQAVEAPEAEKAAETREAEAEKSPDAVEPAASAGIEGEASTGIEEIVVTATKRSENLIKVPIAMTVFTEQSITDAGITRPADFLSSTPNVTFIEDNAGESYINIRGQTSVRNSDPNVAIVIDGVTLSSTKPFNSDLFDLKQIEVLKGPQSALYGRNAAAGAIVVTTKEPGDEFAGHVVASHGNFNSTRVALGAGGPISDTLKFGVSGSLRDTDGPFTSETSGQKVGASRTDSGRARLIYEPDENLKVDLQVGSHKATGASTAYNAQIVGLPLGGFPGTELDANNADIPFVSNIQTYNYEVFTDVPLKVDYDLGFAKFTSISAYSYLKQIYGSDSPPYLSDTGTGDTVQQYSYRDKNYSQEFRLTSPADQSLRWQLGVYALRFLRDQTSKINQDNVGLAPRGLDVDYAGSDQPTVAYSHPLYKTTSYAPFASLQYDLTEKLHLNAAGRYDVEDRSVRETAPDVINPITGLNYNNCVALTGSTIDQCHDSRTFEQFEPKASVSYDLSSNASTYASYGKGFKSGGFNPIGSRQALIGAAEAAGLPASSVYVQDGFDKEVSTSYEIGTKARFFDRALSLNLAAFQTKIEGAQQFEFYPSVGLQTTISIDEVELRGFDADFDALLPFGLRVFGGYGYTDGEVKNFSGNPQFNGNVSPGAFKYTMSVGATQSFELAHDMMLVPRVELNRYGPIWWDVANTPGTRRDPLTLLDARLTLKGGGNRWEISAYGDNLTNEKYFQEVVPLLGYFTVNYRGPTRSYGTEVRFNF